MVVTYCTAANVASFLGVPSFSGSTTPTQTEVEEFINQNEDHIDEQTGHAWRTVTVTDETHHLDRASYQRRDGVPIFLAHRKIKTMSSGSGDKIEIWNGNTFEDYLISRTEGINNDYDVNEEMGIIFIHTFSRLLPRNFKVKIAYRFGESAVANDIKKTCIRLTAIDVLGSDDRSVLLPEGTSNISLLNKVEKWQDWVDKKLAARRELQLAIL